MACGTDACVTARRPACAPPPRLQRAFNENEHLGADSILLPTTKKYTINVMENAWVHKFVNWGDKVGGAASGAPSRVSWGTRPVHAT